MTDLVLQEPDRDAVDAAADGARVLLAGQALGRAERAPRRRERAAPDRLAAERERPRPRLCSLPHPSLADRGGDAGAPRRPPPPSPRPPPNGSRSTSGAALEVVVVDDPDDVPALVAAAARRAAGGARRRDRVAVQPHDADAGRAVAGGQSHRGVVPARSGTVRPPASWPRPRRSKNLPSLADPAWRPWSRCSRIRPSPRPDTTSSTTGRFFAGRESSWRAWHSTRCWRASCSIRAGVPTRSTRCASSTSAGSLQTYADLTGRGKAQVAFAEVRDSGAAAYCGADSATVLALHEHFAPALRDIAVEPLLRDIELPLVHVLDGHGVGGDLDRSAVFARLNAELGADLRRLEREIADVAGEALNLNSPRQLATILFEKQQLPVLKRTKTGPSTDADVLEQLAAMGHALPAADPRLPRAAEAQEHLRRHAARHGQPPHRAASTPASTRPAPPPGGSARPIPTCRTSRSGRRVARRSAAGSSRGPAGSSWWPTTRRSSCASWRTSRATPASSRPSARAATSTGRPRRSSSACRVEQVTPDMRARAKTINFATIYGQGPFALSRQLGISQEDAKTLHRPLLRALRRGARVPRPAWSSWRGSRATSRPSSSAGATSPRSRTATSTCAPTASATRRTRRSRARRPT